MKATYTKRAMARLLSCRTDDVHEAADRLGIPYDVRHGVSRNGNPITRRVYLKVPVDAALDEMGRKAQRGVA